ncbi:MAG: cyclic nucleotide-binding domain-containing protein [Pseudomonadota bacterium]
MLEAILATLNPFTGLEPTELRTLARHARLLELPAGRWLVQPGRCLKGRYYLLHGRLEVRLTDGARRVCAGHGVDAFYPGCRSARTLVPVRLLQVDTDPVAFLLRHQPELGLRLLPGEPWIQRLLGSGLVRRLPPERWQRLLRGLEPRRAAAGYRAINQGEPGDCFYVLREGRARVHRGQRTLAQLEPGDFFGEDAVIARTPRNASVTMQTSGLLMRLPRSAFLNVLVQGVVTRQTTTTAAAGGPAAVLLSLRRQPRSGALPIALDRLRSIAPRLSRERYYLVCDGPPNARVLAVFLLLQAGLRAAVLEEGPGVPAAGAVNQSERSALRKASARR